MQQQYYECTRNGMTLRGMLALPDGTDNSSKVPLVLLLHGFTGSRNEFGFIYHRLAGRLAAEGIASLRFDFMGSGDSDGAFSDMSLLTETEDALAMLASCHELSFVDPARIALNGMSMGGLVACLTAARQPGSIRCLSLWSPALCVADDCRAGRCQDVSLDGFAQADHIDFRGFALGRIFREDALKTDVYREILSYLRPIQVVHGTADNCVPIRFSKKLQATLPDTCTLIKIADAGHCYESIPASEELLRYTVNYLKQQLL